MTTSCRRPRFCAQSALRTPRLLNGNFRAKVRAVPCAISSKAACLWAEQVRTIVRPLNQKGFHELACLAIRKSSGDAGCPHALLAEIEKQGRQYLDEADNGKWVYPACKRTASDAGADKDQIGNHTRLEAVRYLLTVPRGEFRLLAEPGSQPAILDGYLRQLPHDETVIEFTGNTMSDLAIAVIAGFNWLNHCAGLAGADRRKFSGTLNHFRRVAMSAQKWWEMKGAERALRATVAGAAGAAAVPVSGLGGLWPACERDRRGAQNNVARMERSLSASLREAKHELLPGLLLALHPGYGIALTPSARRAAARRNPPSPRSGWCRHATARARARPRVRMISSPARRGSPCLRRV